MTPEQQRRQNHRRRDGRYAKVFPCYVCDKSAGENYLSHPDTDNTINDELLCLCPRCYDALHRLPGPDAVAKAATMRPLTEER